MRAPPYNTDGKMSTVPFNHPAGNHLVIIPFERLAEAERQEEGEQQRERHGEGEVACETKERDEGD